MDYIDRDEGREDGSPTEEAVAAHEFLMRRIAGPRTCVNCDKQPARPTSIYCSDRCKQQFLTFEEVA
jgi:hypothetical protein